MNVVTVPSVDVVVVSVVVLVSGLDDVLVVSVVDALPVIGLLVVLSVVVVLVCANASGAISAQPTVINVFFMCIPFVAYHFGNRSPGGRPSRRGFVRYFDWSPRPDIHVDRTIHPIYPSPFTGLSMTAQQLRSR
ncbi:MAG: hypothetical protein ACJ8JD_08405 [Chthoniobacterales bacterium]